HRTDQPKFALAARAYNFNQRTAARVEQIAANHRYVSGECALGNFQALFDRPETPAVWPREQPGGDSCQPNRRAVGGFAASFLHDRILSESLPIKSSRLSDDNRCH